MEKNTKEHWVETLKRWDSEGNDFGQVCNLAEYNDNAEPSYCALGVLMEMAERNAPKLTFRQRIRFTISNIRTKAGYKVGSFIAGYDIDPGPWYDQ